MPEIKINWPERNILESFSSLINSEELNTNDSISFFELLAIFEIEKNEFSGSNAYFVLEISPPFLLGSAIIDLMLFRNFNLTESSILILIDSFFTPENFEIKEDVTFTIRKPKWNDLMPAALNPLIKSTRECLFLNCYFKDKTENVFLGSEVVLCRDFQKVVKKFLNLSNYGNRNIKISVIDPDGVEGNSVPIYTEFKTLQLKKVTTVLISSKDELKFKIGEKEYVVQFLPEIPKKLLSWSLRNLNGKRNQDQLIRRLALICANSGIPVNLINCINTIGVNIQNLERVGLPLNKFSDKLDFIENSSSISLPINNLRHSLECDPSEIKLRFLVWDSLLQELFTESRNEKRNFRIEPEWNTQVYLDQDTERRIDLAILSERFKLPVLIVEMGKDRSTNDHQHKDFTKLLTMMSQTCIKLCNLVRDSSCDWSNVCVYGLWIGNTQFQFCVAHPNFLINSESGLMDITVSLSFSPHWRFDLLEAEDETKSVSCGLKCCNSELEDSGDVVNILEADEFDWASFSNAPIPFSTNLMDLQDDDDKIEFSPGRKIVIGNTINKIALCKLKVFVDIILKTISILHNAPVDHQLNDRFPAFGLSPTAIIPGSLRAGAFQTPKNDQLLPFETPKTPKTPTNKKRGNPDRLEIRKKIDHEIELFKKFKKLSHLFFPIMIDYKVDPNDEKFCLCTFEQMDSLFGDAIIRASNIQEIIVEAATFAVHSLYGLVLLHEKLELVHGNISTLNIMFSNAIGIWKLNDFSHSMSIEESLKTPRISGTEDFIAPETLKSKIFTTENDIYALGQVLLRFFVLKMIWFLELDADNVDERSKQSVNEFINLSYELTKENPEERVTARKALELFYKFLLKNFNTVYIDFEIYGEFTVLSYVKDEICADDKSDLPMMDIDVSID